MPASTMATTLEPAGAEERQGRGDEDHQEPGQFPGELQEGALEAAQGEGLVEVVVEGRVHDAEGRAQHQRRRCEQHELAGVAV